MNLALGEHRCSNEHGWTVHRAGNDGSDTEEEAETADIGDPFKTSEVVARHHILSWIYFVRDSELKSV